MGSSGAAASGILSAAYWDPRIPDQGNLNPLNWGAKSQPLDLGSPPLSAFLKSVMYSGGRNHGTQRAQPLSELSG